MNIMALGVHWLFLILSIQNSRSKNPLNRLTRGWSKTTSRNAALTVVGKYSIGAPSNRLKDTKLFFYLVDLYTFFGCYDPTLYSRLVSLYWSRYQ